MLHEPRKVTVVREGGQAVYGVDFQTRILSGVHYCLAGQTPLATINHPPPFGVLRFANTDDTCLLCRINHTVYSFASNFHGHAYYKANARRKPASSSWRRFGDSRPIRAVR